MSVFFPKQSKTMRRYRLMGDKAMRPGYIRIPLMAGLLVLMFQLYSAHFERRLEQIEARSSFWDETDLWSDEERDQLVQRAKLFRDLWGLRLVVRVANEEFNVSGLGSNTLFLGLSVKDGAAMLLLPPLVGRALADGNEGAVSMLEQELGVCVKPEISSASCVLEALDTLAGFLPK